MPGGHRGEDATEELQEGAKIAYLTFSGLWQKTLPYLCPLYILTRLCAWRPFSLEAVTDVKNIFGMLEFPRN